MRTIHKYPLAIVDEQIITTQRSKWLHVGLDPQGTPCIWAEVDTRNESVRRSILIIGTGNPIPYGAKHIGSFVQGSFVWHVYC